MQENELRELVRRVVQEMQGATKETPAPAVQRHTLAGQRVITAADMEQVNPDSEVLVPTGAVVTPLARDVAAARRLRLVAEGATRHLLPSGAVGTPPPDKTVALGTDHGGLAMKEDLKRYLLELGYAVLDVGTHSAEAVDYPDFAHAVARLVVDGKAMWGIVVDGAGIGSCMAANKVPGIRAAMCYDLATAANSREHNNANVLTLGGRMVGADLARQIVKTWLGTAFGGGRHARRVDKITAIEQRYLKK